MSPFPNCPVGGQAPPPRRAPSPSPGKARQPGQGLRLSLPPRPSSPDPAPRSSRCVSLSSAFSGRRVRPLALRSLHLPRPSPRPNAYAVAAPPFLLSYCESGGAVSRRLLRLSILPHYLPRSTSPPRRVAASPALCGKGEVRFPVPLFLSRHFPPSPSGPNPPPSRRAAVSPTLTRKSRVRLPMGFFQSRPSVALP